MPRKFSRGKRFVRRATRYARNAYGAWSLAKAAYSGAMKLRRLINVEFKVNDIDHSTPLSPDSTGAIYNLTKIATGDDMTDREGRSILLKSLLQRYTITLGGGASSTFIRWMIIIDRDYLGALPSVSDILQYSTVRSPLNILTQAGSRFKVLVDRVITVDSSGQRAKSVKIYKKLHHHAKYKATTSADSSGLRGQLLFLLMSNESSNLPVVAGISRVRYIDN